MHAYHAIDDELEPRQTDALVRHIREVECPIGITHVHHDLDGNVRQRIQLDLGLLEFQPPRVNESLVSLGATYRDLGAIRDRIRGVAAAYDGRYTEFSRNDRCVASATAAIGDNGRGTLHHRFPVRIRHVRDQYIAVLHAIHLADVANHPSGAGTDLLADAAALADYVRASLQRKALNGSAAAALNGFGAGLQDVDLAVGAVLAPFDIHGTLIVILDRNGHFGQLDDFFLTEREAVRVRLADVDGFNRLARLGVVAVDHLDGLAAKDLAQYGVLAVAERRLVDIELVRIDRALHDGLAEAVRRGDEYRVAKTGLGVECKDHARRAHVAANHGLHAHRKSNLAVIESLMYPVCDCAVIEERSEYLMQGVIEVVESAHIEEGFLLACERRIGQVFCRSGRTHGNRQVLATAHLLPGAANIIHKALR